METTNNEKDSGLHCLVLVANYYGIPADEMQMRHNMAMQGKKYVTDDMLRGAKSLKLKAKVVKNKKTSLHKLTLPAIVRLKTGEYSVIAKADENKVLMLDAYERSPKVVGIEDLNNIWDGETILLIPRDIATRDLKFGLKWFIPSILKYKKPFIEVLAAALMMQILMIF